MLSTIQKINLAKIAYYLVMTVRRLLRRTSQQIKVTRRGIQWCLDLREGIDFSIYILGGFEPSTLRLYNGLVKTGDVVLDIGANIGSHTLPLAKLVGNKGHVYAFEPTDFAFRKLNNNLQLNDALIERVTVFQQMLVFDKNTAIENELFSSWPLVSADQLHEKHKGRLMLTTGAHAVTLDDAISENNITTVDFIKLDVDGFEYAVLSGGAKTINKFKPTILIELAPYVYKDKKSEFIEMINAFKNIGYCFHDANNGKSFPVDGEELFNLIPDGVSRNIVARVNFFNGSHI